MLLSVTQRKVVHSSGKTDLPEARIFTVCTNFVQFFTACIEIKIAIHSPHYPGTALVSIPCFILLKSETHCLPSSSCYLLHLILILSSLVFKLSGRDLHHSPRINSSSIYVRIKQFFAKSVSKGGERIKRETRVAAKMVPVPVTQVPIKNIF